MFGATDTGEAVTALEQFAVDIVITDVHMSNMEGMHFTMGLRHKAPQIKIVVMSGSTRHDLAREPDTLVRCRFSGNLLRQRNCGLQSPRLARPGTRR